MLIGVLIYEVLCDCLYPPPHGSVAPNPLAAGICQLLTTALSKALRAVLPNHLVCGQAVAPLSLQMQTSIRLLGAAVSHQHVLSEGFRTRLAECFPVVLDPTIPDHIPIKV